MGLAVLHDGTRRSLADARERLELVCRGKVDVHERARARLRDGTSPWRSGGRAFLRPRRDEHLLPVGKPSRKVHLARVGLGQKASRRLHGVVHAQVRTRELVDPRRGHAAVDVNDEDGSLRLGGLASLRGVRLLASRRLSPVGTLYGHPAAPSERQKHSRKADDDQSRHQRRDPTRQKPSCKASL